MRGARSIRSVLLAAAAASCSSSSPPSVVPPADASTDATPEASVPDDCVLPPGAIAVTTNVVTDAADGACDLVEAVRAASTGEAVHGDCPAPSGMSPVVLRAGQTYAIHSPLRLTTGVQIQSCGTGMATIEAGGDWTADPADAFGRCAVVVTGDGIDAKLTGVTLSQATAAPPLTGACVTLGSLDLRRGRVTGFGRGGLLASCHPEAGCDHDGRGQGATVRVFNSLVDENHNPDDGGGISCQGPGALLIVEHSSIVHNTSDNNGGGVADEAGWNNHRIANSTISGNSAQVGGGIFAHY